MVNHTILNFILNMLKPKIVFSLRKGKYHRYKLALLAYLRENDFLIKIGNDYPELSELAMKLDIPMSSWYDITKNLRNSELILMRYKNRAFPSGIIVYMVYEIQLTKKGLEFLNSNSV